MTSLVTIAQSWYLYARGLPSTQQLMAERLAICDACPSKKQMNAAGKFVMASINQEGSTYYCGQCSCPLAAKTANPKNRCPLGKWKDK